MATRLTVVIAAGAVACAGLAGCGEEAAEPRVVAPSEYVAAVERLLAPPGEVASSLSERLSGSDAPAPGERVLRALLEAARERLGEFRSLRLRDRRLRRQRDRLASAYARLLPRMRAVVDALVAGDEGAVRAAGDPFLASLQMLPSAAASSPSR